MKQERVRWVGLVLAVGLGLVRCGGDAAAARDASAAFVCAADLECDNGDYCDGVERCRDAACQPGAPPCDAATERCDEATDGCTPIDHRWLSCTTPTVHRMYTG